MPNHYKIPQKKRPQSRHILSSKESHHDPSRQTLIQPQTTPAIPSPHPFTPFAFRFTLYLLPLTLHPNPTRTLTPPHHQRRPGLRPYRSPACPGRGDWPAGGRRNYGNAALATTDEQNRPKCPPGTGEQFGRFCPAVGVSAHSIVTPPPAGQSPRPGQAASGTVSDRGGASPSTHTGAP